MEEAEQNIDVKIIKSPELAIKINQVPVISLIDTGSAVNAISEEWYENNKKQIRHHETLSVNNTTIVSAVGNRSKSIRKQVFLEVVLSSNLSVDCVFLIVPGLVRNCILGMNFLQQSKGVINIPEGWIQVRPEVVTNAEEHPYEVPLLTIEENVCDIERCV